MKITVVGSILIVAAVMAGVFVLYVLCKDSNGLNNRQNEG